MFSLDSGKCKDGNEVVFYCHTNGCTVSPLMCGEETCQCRLAHRECEFSTSSK
jgi:hypothetical protein